MAVAANPAAMAYAFKIAVEAGRIAYETGLAPAHKKAEATSPLTGFLEPTGTR
jgi:thiazole synthase